MPRLSQIPITSMRVALVLAILALVLAILALRWGGDVLIANLLWFATAFLGALALSLVLALLGSLPGRGRR